MQGSCAHAIEEIEYGSNNNPYESLLWAVEESETSSDATRYKVAASKGVGYVFFHFGSVY